MERSKGASMDKKGSTSKAAAVEAAKRYVDQQLKTMKQSGSAPTLSRRDYDELVRKVVAAAQ
jgi:hypothetical protein